MVQGIAFLSKKSWHTKNLANQERVWIAEQRKAAEESKTKELARQIQQEREREELDRMAGKKTHLDRGIDWMYQGQAASGDASSKPSELEQQDAEKRNEEFLLGKEYNAPGHAQGDFAAALESKEGVNAVVKLEDPAAAASVSAYGPGETSVADRNEAFRQRVEDPMFMVSQREREKKTEASKQRALYERVVGPVGGYKHDDDEEEEEDSRRDKKKKSSKKKERKERRKREKEDRKRKRRGDNEDADRHERKRHRRRDDSDTDTDDESKDRRHKRKKDRYHNHSEEDSDREHRRHNHHRSSRRRRSRSRDEEEDRKISRSRRHRSRSRSRSPENSRHVHRSSSDHHSNDRRGDEDYKRQDDYKRDYHRRDQSHPTKEAPTKKAGYGLQGNSAAADRNSNHSPKDLGPAQDLLRKKREAAEEERRRAKERASSRRTMTSEERAQALQEMQAAAQARRDQDFRRKGMGDEEQEAKPNSGKASFLKDMTQQVHGIKGDSHSLSSRMQQNRNTQQRLHDESFL